MSFTIPPLLTSLFLLVAGGVTGFVDSIAGGGGLIALPSISLVVGPGADAIGTNKIAGFAAALIALIVYARHGHVDWRKSIAFTLATSGGAVLGATLGPMVPVRLFPWLLAVTCPVILFVVWKKDLWIAREPIGATPEGLAAGEVDYRVLAMVLGSGFVCGLYDGIWGPGGGTFMFLSLLFVARLPLLAALAAAKLANTASAVTALVSYGVAGHVHPGPGLLVAAGTLVGGYWGAHLASKRASRIVRPVLAIVVTLLLIKLITTAN